MTTHVEQIERKSMVIKPVVSEGVSSKGDGRYESPLCGNAFIHWFGQKRLHIGGRLRQFFSQMRLALLQCRMCRIPIDPCYVAFRMMSNPGDDLHRIGKFDEIVVAPLANASALVAGSSRELSTTMGTSAVESSCL